MSERSNVISSFTIVKGAFIDETYGVLAGWDASVSKKANLDRVRNWNSVGAKTENWLLNVAKVLNRRLDPDGRDRSLMTLAKRKIPLHVFKPILLWHMTRDEFLLRDFLLHFLYPQYLAAAHRVDTSALESFVLTAHERGGTSEHEWAASTLERVVAGLLRMATDFDLLKGSQRREFNSYHLPDEAFLYLLHAMQEVEQNAMKVIHSEDWRMYMMSAEDVERELLRLHQFRRLEFQRAGSLAQLTLPYRNAGEFAERMAA